MYNALLVRPKDPVTFWSLDLAVQMLGKKTVFPPLGLLTIAGMMPEEEYNLRLIDMNAEILRDEDLAWADVVLTSSMIIHWNSLEEVIARCNKIGTPILCGGPLATQYHAEIKGDAIFYLGEAENGFIDIVNTMSAESKGGIASFEGKAIDRRGKFESLEKTPLPRWDLINLNNYSNMVVQMTRGCPEKCTFCNIPALYGKVTRVKSSIIKEMDALYQVGGWRGPVMFVDDNFIGNADAILDALQNEIIPWQKEHGYPFRFNTQASLRVADNPELMEAMFEAGFDKMFAGIESPVPESLQFMGAQKNKQGDKTLLDKVQILQRSGFEVQGGFIMGFDTDPENIGDIMLDFIRQAGIPMAMAGPLGVLPDTADYTRYSRKGRLVEGVRYGGESGLFSRQLSFKPKGGTDWLLNQHRNLLQVLNSPEIYFERCLTLFKNLRPREKFVRMPIRKQEIRALFLSFWRQGVLSNYRLQYWKYLYNVLQNHRQFLPDAVRLAVQGHHFILMTQQALRVDDVQTFMEVAAEKFELFAQGSRDAFSTAEGRAGQLISGLRLRLNCARNDLSALQKNARVLKKAARGYCKSVVPGFRSQLDISLINFQNKLDNTIKNTQGEFS